MKLGKAERIMGAALIAGLISAIPCFAGNSSGGTAAAVAGHDRSAVAANPSRSTAAEASAGSWKNSMHDAAQNLREAAHNIEIASERAYAQVARNATDPSLEAKIQAMLHENKYTRGVDVHATASNGVVTLTGQVPSEQSAERVREVVASVYGVKAVRNDLNYPKRSQQVTPRDAISTGIAHPAYSRTAPMESAPTDH